MISLDKSGNAADVWVVVAKLIAFFAMAIPMGYVALFIIRRIDLRYPHTRRIPILCVVVCFVFAYAAENSLELLILRVLTLRDLCFRALPTGRTSTAVSKSAII